MDVVIACRPMRIEDYPPHRQKIWHEVARATEVPQIYPGSVYLACEMCGIQVAVGPRQQEAMATTLRGGDDLKLLCMIDAVIASTEPGVTSTVQSLGNPFRKRP